MPASGQMKVMEDLETKLELMETHWRMKESALRRKETEMNALRLALKQKDSIIKHASGSDAFDHVQKAMDLENKLKEALDRVAKLQDANFKLERAQRSLVADSSVLASRTLQPISRNEGEDEASLIPIAPPTLRLNKGVSKRHSMPFKQENDVRAMHELLESQLNMKEATLRRKENDIVALQVALTEKDSIIKNSAGSSTLDHVQKAADLERKLKEALHKIAILETRDRKADVPQDQIESSSGKQQKDNHDDSNKLSSTAAKRKSLPASDTTNVGVDTQMQMELVRSHLKMKDSALRKKEDEIKSLRKLLQEQGSMVDTPQRFDTRDHGPVESANEIGNDVVNRPSRPSISTAISGGDLKAKIELLQSQLKMKESTLKRKEDEISELQKLLKEKDSISEKSLSAVEAVESSSSEAGKELKTKGDLASNETLSKGASFLRGGIDRFKRRSMPSSALSGDLKGKTELIESQLKMKESTLKRKDDEINRLQDLLKEKESIIKNYVGDAAQGHGQAVAELEGELKDAKAKIETMTLEKIEASRRQHTAIDGDSGPVEPSVVDPSEQDEIETDRAHRGESSTAETNPRASQQRLTQDLYDEIGMLRMQLSDMMEQTESLANDLDEKDIALKHAETHLQRLRQDNERLRSAVEAIGDTTEGESLDDDRTEVSTESLHEKLRSAQQKIAANKLLITSLREELDSEKHHREELEVLVSEKDSDSSARVSDSHSSSTSEKYQSIIIEDFDGGQPVRSAPIVRSKTREVDLTGDESAEESVKEKSVADLGHTGEKLPGTEIHMDGEIVELRHSIGQKDELIEMLRAKQREQEALISLLNKTLSEKDTKITRLERILADVHNNVNISKELEENELTIDSLVLIRNEKEMEIEKLKEKVDDLEDRLKEFEETKYQLRHRTEEIAEKETKIHELKAELEDESKRVKQMLDDRQEHLDQVRDEKMHLRLDSQDQSRKFEIQLREKEELIKSIYSEATERGLLIDSLDSALIEAKTRLRQLESEIKQQRTENTGLAMKLGQVAQEKSNLIEEHREKDILIRMLNDARLDGEKTIAELTKPKRETNRQKILRRYKQMQAEEGVSGLDTYMEPFVIELHQAQEEYQKARKNLRLAKARERLIRPRV